MLITYADMLITFERVWAVPLVVSTWDVVFPSRHNNRELEQSPTGGVLSQSGAHQSTTCQKGVLPKLSGDGGVYPRASIPDTVSLSSPQPKKMQGCVLS